MIRQANIGDSVEALKMFLDNYVISKDNPNGIFNSVTIREEYAIVCTAGDPSVTVLQIAKVPDSVGQPGWDVVSYFEGGSVYLTLHTDTASTAGAELVNKMDFVYGTDNGFMLHFTYDKVGHEPNLFATVLVAKSKDVYPIVVVPDLSVSASDPTDNDFTHLFAKIVHYTDSAALPFAMCQIDTAMQTAAVPFVSYGNHTELSFSPHAFWMPVSNSYASGFCRMSFNETQCVSNGYWFIDDAQEEGEADGN